MNWIDLKVRRPNLRNPVLWWSRCGEYHIGHYVPGKQYIDGDILTPDDYMDVWDEDLDSYTHWTPLPEPPQ